MENGIDSSHNIKLPESANLPNSDHLRNISQAVIISGLDGTISFWNKAATEIYGWTDEEALGKNIIELIPTQQTKEQAIEIMQLLSQGQSWSGEFIVHRKNGECFSSFVTDLPFYNDQDILSGVVGISTDLTAQKRSERELNLLYNNAVESYILLDTALNIISFNKQAYNLYKKHVGGLLSKGSPILKFAKPNRIEPLKEIYQKILAGDIHESEINFKNEQGIENTFALKYTPAKDESDHIIGIFISVREITEQKLAQAALIANEAKWHALVENFHDIFIMLDKQRKIQYVSPAIIKLLKFNEEELLYSDLVTMFEPDDEKIINKLLTKSSSQPATQLLTGRTRIRNKTGKAIWVEGYVTNLLDKKDINGIIYTAWEVTDLVEGEASLKTEQKNKEALINATDDLIWSINKNYELVAANAAFVKTLKQSTGIELKPGDSLIRNDKFTDDFLTFWQSQYIRAFAGESFQEEIFSPQSGSIKDASWAVVNFNPILQKNKVTGIACLSRNITERKRQEEKEKELAVNQSLYSAIINASQDAIISKNLYGIITSWNRGAEKIFGYGEAEIIGKSITTIIPPELIDEEVYIISQIKAKQPVGHYDTVRTDKNGNRKTVSLTVSPILNIDGEVIGASKIARDITRQKQDAFVLQQNEARLQGIFASQTNYIIRTDLQGNYSYYNDKFFNDFGWLHKQENLIGISGMESIMPYHHQAVLDTVNKCLSEPNKVFQVEMDKPALDGGTKTTFWDFICLTDLAGNPVEIQCVGIEITQRVIAEKELKQSLKDRNYILESIGDAFFAVDKNWITTYWNRNAEMMLGVAKEEIIGKNVWEIFPVQTATSNYDNFKAVLESGESRQYEYFHSATSKWYEMSIYPAINGLSVYLKNITERKKTDVLILEANERFNLASLATSDVIWDWDIVKDTVVKSPENMKKVFGYDKPEQVNGFDFWLSNIHPEDTDAIILKIKLLFENAGESFMDSEYRVKKSDGTYANVYDKGYVIRNASGNPLRMIGAVRDITWLKENELLLKAKAEELAASNKELEHFAFIASHDLQEPLRMVTSFLSQLKKNYEPVLDKRANDYIGFAVDGAVRMRQIILDLLEYSRVGRLKQNIEKVNSNEVVDEIMLLVQKKIEELSATIVFNNLPVIKTHRSPFHQVMQNLIINALKFTKPGEQPKIEITASQDSTHWTFAVKDNGIGIEKEYFHKIFVIFQRLNNREEYAGSGIGLSIAKKIVETLGGSIWVESTEGQGATFYFTVKKV